jgi:hypothetical protein
MNPTFDNTLVASFLTWFDFTLSNNGGAFSNTSSLLYPIPTDYFKSQHIYASPYRPWVYDTSIQGTTIPSGVYDANGNFLTRASGIYINFQKGWIGTTGAPLNAPLSGNYSFKEWEIFYTNENEDSFLFQTKFITKPEVSIQAAITGLGANVKTFPCVGIKYNPGTNKDFAFGGTQLTCPEFRCLVVSDSTFNIDAILSIFRDTRHASFSLINPSNLPLNSFGDYKSGIPFNYINNISPIAGSNPWIRNVDCIKFSDSDALKIDQKTFTALIDFTIEIPRNLKLIYPQNIQ